MNDILSYEEQAVFRLRALYERNGYRPYRMSKFEEYDLYAENKGFLVSSNIITFTDLSGRLMALKPDVTLSIIKNYPNDGVMEKVYYDESVYRASSPDSGYQEITQMGLECIGCVDDYSTAEVIRLAVESLALIRGEYLLNLSHMGFLRGLFDEMHLSEKQSSRLLRAICSKNTGELRQTLTDWAVPHRLIQIACSLTALHGPLSQQLQPLAALSVNGATDAACRQRCSPAGGMTGCWKNWQSAQVRSALPFTSICWSGWAGRGGNMTPTYSYVMTTAQIPPRCPQKYRRCSKTAGAFACRRVRPASCAAGS